MSANDISMDSLHLAFFTKLGKAASYFDGRLRSIDCFHKKRVLCFMNANNAGKKQVNVN